LSFFCLVGFGGALAVVLGWLAHGEIDRSDGRLTGKGIASAGIALGIANMVLTLVGVGTLIALAVRPEPPSVAMTPPALRPPPAAAPPLVPPIARPHGPALPPQAEAEAEPELPILPPRIGDIAIIDASIGGDALETQLLTQLEESAKSGEHLVLWTVKTDCEPCDAVGRALGDPRMQHALAKVRLIRADAGSFPSELQRLGVPSQLVPGFTLLDARAHALDHIHGGEWDADIPANIAPILDKFLHHGFTRRRHPWARPLREGETPL
jgi:hypothetical protein